MSPPSGEPPPPPPLRVLLVEDNDRQAKTLRRVFRGRPMSLRVATDGEAGLALLRSWRPQLTLLDLHLPRLSGLDVIRAASADPGADRCPIVVLTSSDAPADIERVSALKCQYITKPATLDETKRLADRIEGFWCHAIQRPVVDG